MSLPPFLCWDALTFEPFVFPGSIASWLPSFSVEVMATTNFLGIVPTNPSQIYTMVSPQIDRQGVVLKLMQPMCPWTGLLSSGVSVWVSGSADPGDVSSGSPPADPAGPGDHSIHRGHHHQHPGGTNPACHPATGQWTFGHICSLTY